MSKKKTEDNEPFYINKGRLKAEEMAYKRNLLLLRNALDTYTSVVGVGFQSFEDFKTMLADPRKYYTDYLLAKNEERTANLRSILGEDYSLEKFAEVATVFPKGFDKLVTQCSRIQNEKINFKTFALVENEIQLGQDFYTRQIGKSIFYATTSLDKKRLAYATKVKELLMEQGDLLKMEAEELGLQKKINAKIQSLDFLGTIPYCLKIEVTGYDEKNYPIKELIVNETFVIAGHRGILPEFIPKQTRPQEPQRKYRVAHVKQSDGSTAIHLVAPDGPIPLDTFRTSKTKLLPDFYVVENGRLRSIGKAERYPEHPMIEQL